MLKLHLIRHAKTEQADLGERDFDRKLLAKGEKQATLLATYLKKIDGIPIYCSTAKRTRQTCTFLIKELKNNPILFFDELYLADYQTIFTFLTKINEEKEIILIGHNNGISDLASYLSGEFISLKTSGYLSLQFDFDSWEMLSKETGTIIDRYRPEV